MTTKFIGVLFCQKWLSVLGCLLMLTLPLPFTPTAAAASVAYIEPSLLAPATETVSVIVTAQTAGVAALAVASIGGQVTHNLWLINAVATSLPAALVSVLAHLPGIVSVVANRDVQIANRPLAGMATG